MKALVILPYPRCRFWVPLIKQMSSNHRFNYHNNSDPYMNQDHQLHFKEKDTSATTNYIIVSFNQSFDSS